MDYIVSEEGEVPFEVFLETYPNVENVPNLIYKNENGEVHFNKQIVDFDIEDRLKGRNPYQYDDLSALKHKVAYIETSRGCPYKCEFCLASLDNAVRYLDIPTIKDNLKFLMEHGRVVKFLDRTFNIKRDFTIDMFDFIMKNHYPGNVFQFEITADIVHKDIITYINENVTPGVFRFEIGIQTVNQESNREVGRKQNFTKTSDIINQIKDKVEMHLDLIVGLPLETFDMLRYSFNKTFLLYPPELQLGFLKFLKGTPLRDKYQVHGYDFDPNPPYEIISSDFMSVEELDKARLVEGALEIYWNKKRALNTLHYVSQKYSTFDFLLEMGEFFLEKHLFYKHSLNDIYERLIEFIQLKYPEDKVMYELALIDYYLYNTLKGPDIFKVEAERKEHFAIVDKLYLNHNQYRFAIFPISFNIESWLESNTIEDKEDMVVLQFDGVNAPSVMSKSAILLENTSNN